MGLLSKKVTRTRTEFKHLFGDDPLKKEKYGKSSIKKGMLDSMVTKQMIRNKAKGMSSKENMKDLIFSLNNIHAGLWVNKKTNYDEAKSLTKIVFSDKKFEAVFGTNKKILSSDVDGLLFLEYLFSLQNPNYNISNKTWQENGYVYKIDNPLIARIVEDKSKAKEFMNGNVSLVEEIARAGVEINLTDNILNKGIFPPNAVYKDITTPAIDTSKIGKYTGVLEVSYTIKDKKYKFTYDIPVIVRYPIGKKFDSEKDLGYILDIQNYIHANTTLKLRDKLLKDFGVNILDESMEVKEEDLNHINMGSTLDKKRSVIKVSAHYTWKDHTKLVKYNIKEINKKYFGKDSFLPDFDWRKLDGFVSIDNGIITMKEVVYEFIELSVELPIIINLIDEIADNANKIFIEYEDENKVRKVFYEPNMDRFVDSMSMNMSFSPRLPIKDVNIPPTKRLEKKYWDIALQRGNYKNKNYARKPKKYQKALYEMLASNNNSIWFYAQQHIDLRWFFKKDIRSDRFWQKYLQTIFKFFETSFNVGRSIQTAPENVFTIGKKLDMGHSGKGEGQARFKIKLAKKTVINKKILKKCFLGMEPNHQSLCLYLNVADYSLSTDEERERGIYYQYHQYILDLGFWYGTRLTKGYTVVEEMFSSRLDNYIRNFYTSYETKKYIARGGENVAPHWANDKIPPIPIFKVDMPDTWLNEGNQEIKKEKSVRVKECHMEYGESTEKEVCEWKEYPYVYVNKEFYYDDRNDMIPSDIDMYEVNPPMPSKLWIKVPMSVQKHVGLSTIFYTCHFSWEEKEGTFLGDILGGVLVVIGILIIYLSYGIATPAGQALVALGVSITGSGVAYIGAQIGSKLLQIIGVLISLYGAFSAPLTATTMLGQAAQYAGKAAVVVSAINSVNQMIQSDKLGSYKKQLEAQANKDKSDKEKMEEYMRQEYHKPINTFDVNSDFTENMDMYYDYFAPGVFIYEAMNNGTYFSPYDSMYDKDFERFTQK